MLVNIAAVLWLIWSKRLFGVRGGGAAYRAEHSAESLLTVERSAWRNRGPRHSSTDFRPPGRPEPCSRDTASSANRSA